MNMMLKLAITPREFYAGWMRFIVVFALLLNAFSLASAQETEPNDACLEAQDIGAITLPYSVDGSLDTPPEVPDVDFFRVEVSVDTPLTVDLEGEPTNQGTLSDPYVGLFDSDCNLLAANDDTGSLNARLQFVPPADGILILAATSCCDDGFSGDGGSSGTYQLTIGLTPPAIESISGRLVDAFTGEPLRGNTEPYGSVDLLRCNDESCSEYVASQSTDGEGEFLFEQDYNNNPLSIGTYQIQGYAENYETTRTEPFYVGEDEDFDLGEVALRPPPVQFSDVRPCDDLPPEGGDCLYSVRITNVSPDRIRGRAWSLVESYGIGSWLDYTQFQATGFGRVSLRSGQSRIVRFWFTAPEQMREGASICTRVFFGEGRHPYFETLDQRFLFCIQKGAMNEFNVLSDEASQKLLNRSHKRSPIFNQNK